METTTNSPSANIMKHNCKPEKDKEKKLKKKDAQDLYDNYRKFIDSLGDKTFFIFRPLTKQPGYLKISRTAITEILESDPEQVGGLGIAFGMTDKHVLTTMVGPLKKDGADGCKLIFEENTIYDDLGQGDDPEGLIKALSAALNITPEKLTGILQANKLL